MDIYEAIEKRRTIRKFKGQATEEQLIRIIKAGAMAPSGANIQNWEFIIVDDPALIEKISVIKHNLNIPHTKMLNEDQRKYMTQEMLIAGEGPAQRESFAQASLVMVYYKCKPKGLFTDTGAWMCIENMLLAAVAEGLQTRIAAFWGNAKNEVNKLMQAPEEYDVAAAITIGIPAEAPVDKPLRPDGSWLHRNRF